MYCKKNLEELIKLKIFMIWLLKNLTILMKIVQYYFLKPNLKHGWMI